MSAAAFAATALTPLLSTARACDGPNCPNKKSTFTPAKTVVDRRDIASMSADDPGLKLFRDAVREMKRRSAHNPMDPAGWLVQANAHAMFCATQAYELQVHYCWFFLPWHRAYLWNFENVMRHVLKEPKFALPYWDWTKHPRIPDAYWGDTATLENPTRLMLPTDRIPADFIDVRPALRSRDFRQFGGYEKTVPASLQIEGIVEQGVHNNVHNWVGGDMGSFVGAGFDPLFTGHHGQIDRLWEAWLKAHPSHTNPTATEFLDKMFHFTGPDGSPVRIKVRELLDTRQLGYEYDHLDFTLRLPGVTAGDESAVVANPAVRTSVPVLVPEDERGPIITALQERRRVLVFFDRVQVTHHPLCVRVFFDLGDGAPYDTSSANFAGTFTLLPVGSPEKGKALEEIVSMQFEVHPSIADAIENGRQVSVTFVPVRLRGRAEPDQVIRLQGVRMFVRR